MRIFELRYYYYEESDSWIFTHEDKTDKQFEEDVYALLKKHGREYIEQASDYAGVNEWVEYIIPKLYEMGYKTLSPHCVCFPGSLVIGKCDKEWEDIVGEELFNEAIQHNEDV